MKVEIHDQHVVIGEEALPFYGYYFAIAAEENNQTWLSVMKDVLSQWSEAVAALEDEGVAFLPYSLEDEWVECVEATRKGERVFFRCVDVAANGYGLILEDLGSFMLSPQELDCFRQHPEKFGEYDRREIISALKNAEIVGGDLRAGWLT